MPRTMHTYTYSFIYCGYDIRSASAKAADESAAKCIIRKRYRRGAVTSLLLEGLA